MGNRLAKMVYGGAEYILAGDDAVKALIDDLEHVLGLPGGRGLVTVDLAHGSSATFLVSSEIPILIGEYDRPTRPRVISFGDGGEETA